MLELKLPEIINYECQGCGKCCGGWAVPMTEADYDRISNVDWSAIHPAYKDKELYRELRKHEKENTPYTHKIVSDSGTCPFLVDNLCFIHSKNGSEFKPSICQLFPYCFTETPSGVYATVSFVSAGAAGNAGRPLKEQQETLEHKFAEFKKMFPDYQPDWSHTKLTVDQPITWDQYMEHERMLLTFLADTTAPVESRLERCSAYLVSNMQKANVSPEQLLSVPVAALKPEDVHILMTFHKMYFPAKPLKQGEGDFSVMGYMSQKLLGGKRLRTPAQTFSLDELHAVAFPERDPQIEDLIYRYVYSYVFGKKYFGAGFGQVSVIAGFHHVVLMIALLKLHSRISAKLRGSDAVSFADVAATVRQLERQVGETKLGGYAAGLWELLLAPPQRARRFLKHS